MAKKATSKGARSKSAGSKGSGSKGAGGSAAQGAADFIPDSLREAGKQSRLTVYEGLEHDLGDSTARIEMLEQIGRFLEERLGSR